MENKDLEKKESENKDLEKKDIKYHKLFGDRVSKHSLADDQYERASHFDRFRRLKLRNLTPKYELSLRQLDDMEEAFILLDKLCRGKINLAGLRVAIRALGYEPRTTELLSLLALVDHDKSGNISFEDFQYLMAVKMFELDPEEDLKKSFHALAADGKITFKSLRNIADNLEEDVNDEMLKLMIREADPSGSGSVTETNFIDYIKKNRITPNVMKKM